MTEQAKQPELPKSSLIFVVFFLGAVFGGVIATVALSNVERVVYVKEVPWPRAR